MGRFFNIPPKVSEAVTAELLTSVEALFEKKGWRGQVNTLNQFCRMLLPFSQEQREFLIELSGEFIWLGLPENRSSLMESFILADQFFPDDAQRIFILPLKKEKDRGVTKSCDTAFNFFRDPEFRNFVRTRVSPTIQIHPIATIEIISKRFNEVLPQDVIIFVDDYVGSGLTAKDCVLESMSKCPGITKGQFIVVSIIAQRSGIEFLNKNSINIVCKYSTSKGISENFAEAELADKIRLMEEIERLVDVSKAFQFGFEKSEALASLITTPNNTFPVFWFDKSAKHIQHTAPFPRG